jgi:hypothetical protein
MLLPSTFASSTSDYPELKHQAAEISTLTRVSNTGNTSAAAD